MSTWAAHCGCQMVHAEGEDCAGSGGDNGNTWYAIAVRRRVKPDVWHRVRSHGGGPVLQRAMPALFRP